MYSSNWKSKNMTFEKFHINFQTEKEKKIVFKVLCFVFKH